MKNLTMGETIPEMFITKNKQRIKQYDNTVYLKNGEEFEIELFNGTQHKILSKILINNVSIGSGIVLKPGERVFLDRFINDPKKFLFETYNVDVNNKNVQKAIEKNGIVKVEFFKEQCYGSSITYTTTTIPFFDYNTTTCNYSSTYIPDNSNIISCSSNSPMLRTKSVSNTINNVETGRVEKGGISTQKLGTDYSNFERLSSWVNEWKILPESRKIITSDDLIFYCTECGSKKKKSSHKFCPNCGTKY